MHPKLSFILLPFLLLLSAEISFSQEDTLEWPVELVVRGQDVTIYQPQTENYTGEKLEARAAFSVDVNSKPIFGAMWFSSRVVTDKDLRLAQFDQLHVEEVKFPEEDEQKLNTFVDDLNEIFNEVDLSISLDRFLADQEAFSERREIDLEFNNAPPTIYFETTPAVLVLIDGDPILKELENTSYKYVVNTPYFILSDSKTGNNYLKGGQWWYSSNSLTDNWKATDNVPDEIIKISEQAFSEVEEETDSAVMSLPAPPKVILSTSAAELIQTDGEPNFNPVTGTELLFVDNSENDIILSIEAQEYYVLISGRWYKSKSMDSGTWTFVRSDELPGDFQKIPEEAAISNVRSSVAGTQEAKEAILENSIPQTAEIDRKTATVEVKYDGNPKFEKIEGTNFLYAANSDKTVLKSNNKYYCVDNAIWFESNSANGPWEVSVSVPEGVEDIPPSSPVYNVKYVYVYDSTPDVVYVGYTPGYYWSFPYYGSVIYGTGYYYRPWYYSAYYPRPVTYGFGVHYNPWTGWGFSFGVSYGWLSFSFHSGGYHGWWGPCGYRYGYRHGYYNGYRHGYWQGRRDALRNNRPSTRPARLPGTVASNNRARPQARPANTYRDRVSGVKSTGVRPATRPTQRPSVGSGAVSRPSNPTTGNRPSTRPANRPAQTRPSTKPNNVYSDRSGNIYRQDSGNWQQRNKGSWQNSNKTPSSINRSYQNRSRGQQRVQSYQRSAPSRGGYRGGGMRRGR